jgi:Fe(3+) dicitrate transport protein
MIRRSIVARSAIAALCAIMVTAAGSSGQGSGLKVNPAGVAGSGNGAERGAGGGISGRVVAERTGEPLPGAVIEVQETATRLTANEAGWFRVDGLRAGRYTLEVRLLGRSQGTQRVRVDEGRISHVDIALGVAPVTLDALSVKLERTEMVGRQLTRIPGSAHVLNAEQVTGRKLAFDDVQTMLRQVPGVNVSDEEGHGRRPNIGMRGTGVGRSAKITVMEDGVLAAPAPYAAPAAYLFPVAGRMESIEVRKGSSQVRYGPWSTGGALNLISSPVPATLQGLVDVAGGQDRNAKVRARVGSTHGRFGWLAETYQLQTDGFKELDTGGPTGFALQDYLLKLRLNSGPDAKVYQDVELKLVRTDEASHETYLGLADSDFAATPLRRYAGTEMDRLDTGARQYQLRHFMRPMSGFDVTTIAYRNEFARGWYKLDRMATGSLSAVLTDPAQAFALGVLRGADSEDHALIVRANNREYLSQGVQSVAGMQFELAGAHAVEVGVRYHRDSEDRFQHEDAYRMRAGRMELTRAGAPGTQDNRVVDARAVAIFVEDRITLGAWTVSPGVRREWIDFTSTEYVKGDATRVEVVKVIENGVNVWVPGVGVTRLVGGYGQVFGGVHRGFGPPGPGAEEATRAEMSVNYELGGRLVVHGVSVQAAAFYNDYTNILGKATLATGESGSGELFNGGAVVVTGIETSAEYDVAHNRGWRVRLPLRAAYTYTDARFQTAFQSGFGEWGTVQIGDELPYLPKHQGFISIGVAAPRWRGDVSAMSSAAMRTRAGSGPMEPGFSTDAFTVVNVTGEYGVTTWTRLFAGVQNVTDERYVVARRPAGARPGLPRTWTLGVRATLR